MLRELSRSLKLDPDRWLPNDQEIAKMKEAEAKNPKPDTELMKWQVTKENNEMDFKLGQEQLALKREELQGRRDDNQSRMQLEVTQAAADQQMTQQEAMDKYGFEAQRMNAELQDRKNARDHRAQMANAEMQLKAQMGTGI
jgi:hypothetical protein